MATIKTTGTVRWIARGNQKALHPDAIIQLSLSLLLLAIVLFITTTQTHTHTHTHVSEPTQEPARNFLLCSVKFSPTCLRHYVVLLGVGGEETGREGSGGG